MYSTFTNHIFDMVKMHFEVKRVSMIAINSKDMVASNCQVCRKKVFAPAKELQTDK